MINAARRTLDKTCLPVTVIAIPGVICNPSSDPDNLITKSLRHPDQQLCTDVAA